MHCLWAQFYFVYLSVSALSCTRPKIFRQWITGGNTCWAPVLHWTVVSQDICPSVEDWGIISITQHARIHTARTSSPTNLSLWRSKVVLWLSLLHQYTAFPLKPPLLGARVFKLSSVPCHTVIYHSPVEHCRKVRVPSVTYWRKMLCQTGGLLPRSYS